MNSVKCSLDPHSVPKSLFPKLLGVLQMDSFGCQLSLEQSELKRATGIQDLWVVQWWMQHHAKLYDWNETNSIRKLGSKKIYIVSV